MATTLAITATQKAGFIIIDQALSNAPALPVSLSSIDVITNDISVTGPFKVTSLNLLDDNELPLSKHELGVNILPLGVKHHVVIRYTFSNGLIVTSNNLLLTNKSFPNKPDIDAGIRAEDANISINPSLMGFTNNSISDGFDSITKLIVYISKVLGDNENDFQIKEVPIPNDGYSKWHLVNPNFTLVNGIQYEVAIAAVNSFGTSLISATKLITPADVPSQIIQPVVYSLLSEQKIYNSVLNDTRGDIVVYFQKPDDYDNLIDNLRPVTKYILYEQEYSKVVTDNVITYERIGSSVATDLVVPSHSVSESSGASFELETPFFIDGVGYNYRYVVTGSASRIGKIYRYSVVAINVNGSGPVSNESESVSPFLLPSSQTYELTHNNVTSNDSGAELTTYNGKMKIRVSDLSSVNGGKDDVVESIYNANNSDPSNPIYDVNMSLTVKTTTAIPSTVFNGVVKLLHVPTVNEVDEQTTYTASGIYELDFDDVNIDVATLNDDLLLGTKYNFILSRRSFDPWNGSIIFTSVPVSIERTKFSSPERIPNIQSYAVYDDLTTVSTVSQPALRLVFEQLTAANFNGMNSFVPLQTEYKAYQNSLPVQGVDVINHEENFEGEKEFIVPQSSLGTLVNLYIRGKTFNPELNVYVDHLESSPAVQEAAFLAPPAVSLLTLTKPSEDSLTISFTRQTASSLSGNISTQVQNRVILYDTITNSVVESQVILWSAGTTGEYTFSGLTTGNTYVVSVIAERLYTKPNPNSSTNRFFNSIIRSNAITRSVVINGLPSAPTNVQVLPSKGRFEVLWDPPLTLNGLDPVNVRTHFYLNEDNTDFPESNVSVADASGSSSIAITNAFRTKADAINRANLLAIRDETDYYFSSRVIGTVGGHSLEDTSFISEVETYFNGANTISSIVNLSVDSIVPEEIVSGELTEPLVIMSGDSVPTPVVSVAAASGVLSITVDKEINNITDLYITLDQNDALNQGGTIVDAFDTRAVKAPTSGGLFVLESHLSGQTVTGAPDANTLQTFIDKYGFSRTLVNGVTKYNMSFGLPGNDNNALVNGQLYTISVRYARLIGDKYVFSSVTEIIRAPEAPPTTVTSQSFTVDSERINVSWSAPSNSGGAGVSGNGSLQYRVELLNTADAVIRTVETSSLSNSLTGLTNGDDYKVRISAFYLKSDSSVVIGPSVQANTLHPSNLIRVNPAPLPPSSVTITVGSNSISGTVVVPTQLAYPIDSYSIVIRQKATPSASQEVAIIPQGEIINNTFTFVKNDDVNIGSHTRLLNGFQYEVVIVSNPGYFYAQAPPVVLRDAMPFGQLSITSVTNPQGVASNKTVRFVVNLNGSGSIQNIVALAKSSESNGIVVQNLGSGGTGALPTITNSGTIDNTTGVAANQIAQFDLQFASLPASVADVLAVVVSQKSSDTIVIPDGGQSFFD